MSAENQISREIRGLFGSRRTEAVISALAEHQHRVVSRAQLIDNFAIGRDAIDRRINNKRLHRVHKGVYAVGSRKLSTEGRLLAAVLAGGPDAFVCGQSAAAYDGFARDDPRQVHLAAKTTRKRRGIRFHEYDVLSDETTTKNGIPITTPARTLLDCAATFSPSRLEQSLREALYHNRTTLPALRRLIDRHPGHRGAKALKAAIASVEDAPGITRSTLERRFEHFRRRHKLPPPKLNARLRIEGTDIEADCWWPAQRLIVELDDRSTHARRQDFERDRRRDRKAQAAGLRIVRVTNEDLADEAALAQDFSRLFAAAVQKAA
jgi:very-short-patch-repair endonuclease